MKMIGIRNLVFFCLVPFIQLPESIVLRATALLFLSLYSYKFHVKVIQTNKVSIN